MIERRLSFHYFWPGFKPEDFVIRYPFLARKYRLIHDQATPDLQVFSVFPHNDDGAPGKVAAMPSPPLKGIRSLFVTGENVAANLSACDFAITFNPHADNRREMRIPNWVSRLYLAGYSPQALVRRERAPMARRESFCAFVYRMAYSERERLFKAINARQTVDAPGESMNNCARLGPSIAEKLSFLKRYRFNIACENAQETGYTTEKIVESYLAGCVPIYHGDPLIGRDFNPESFVSPERFASLGDFIDELLTIDADPARLRELQWQPAYVDNRLPECADEDAMMAFFDLVFAAPTFS